MLGSRSNIVTSKCLKHRLYNNISDKLTHQYNNVKHIHYTTYNKHYNSNKSTIFNKTTITTLVIGSVLCYIVHDNYNSNSIIYADSHDQHNNNDDSTDQFLSPSKILDDVIHNNQTLAQSFIINSEITIASRWRRIIAVLIDATIMNGISELVHYTLLSSFNISLVPISLVLNTAYVTLTNVQFNGQTLGKYLLKIRTIKEDGRVMDYKTATLEYLYSAIFNMVCLSDVLYSLFNIGGQYKCIHNKLTNTLVVYNA